MVTCQHLTRLWEPLTRVRQPGEDGPIQFNFGKVPVCAYSTCRKIMGDVVLFKSADKSVQKAVKAFKGTSLKMMLDSHPWPPYLFKMGSEFLIPDGYDGELKGQPTIGQMDCEEPPF